MWNASLSESVTDSDFCEDINMGDDIFEKLGLSEFFPDKITLSNVRRQNIDKDNDKLSDIKWILISKLISLNAKARDSELEPILKSHMRKIPPEGANKDFDDVLAYLLEKEFSENSCQTMTFHPLDIFLSVFGCCSPFLKQLIVSKMFTCRLAVPLISKEFVNSGTLKFLSWPLRGIMIEGMSTDQKQIQISLVKSELKVVSFIRLGRPNTSKSKLINEVLSNQYHDTFFNNDCPLGTSTKCISNGLIEASWFLPTHERGSVFSDVVMFLNLRGDGNEYIQQCKILQLISNVVVIIVESDELLKERTVATCMDFQSTGETVVYAVDYNLRHENVKKNIKSFMEQMQEFFEKMEVINIVNKKGSADVKEDLRKRIKDILNEKRKTSIEKIIENIKLFSVFSDENFPSCCKGKSKVDSLMTELYYKKKKDILPLQKEMWIEYTKVLKLQRKASESLNPLEIDKMEQQLNGLRRTQHKKGEELCSALKMFISTLEELDDSEEEIQYFLIYLKTGLDEMSRYNLPELRHKYHIKWAKWDSEKGRKNPHKLSALKQEVDQAEFELDQAPFGYEHFIREIGQLFECTQKVGPLIDLELINIIPRCPQLVAKQLLLGQPLEIIDGDASNIPNIWIKAVFQELQNLIGNTKVLSLSILGIQSSGKSTLLNTMFGLQFAVSAGRCTKGVFLQVLPLPPNKYPFEYLLVIDTEGLRSPERADNEREDSKHEHDNEIATFVIGLGDVTIINVKGENTAEVNDVLQIAVHAFLRLQLTAKHNIRLHQSCIFVHQNVPAKDAKEKMMHGRKKFAENLDIMTKEAAEQENISHISSFKHVMDFDSEDHVFYFSDLWYGNPPMAPVNEGYSTNAETLKEFIFSDIVSKRKTYLTLSDTRQRMLDLWEGILTDDFVFSFRNSLEVKAYNFVETIFQEIKWGLEKYVFNLVFSTFENKYACCKTIQECETAHNKNKLHLMQCIKTELERSIDCWKGKLRESPLQEIVIQWKEGKINSLRCFAEEQSIQGLKELSTLKEQRILIIKNKQGLSAKESWVFFKKAKDIAESMQGKQASLNQLNCEFDKMWKSCTEDFNVKKDADAVPVKEQIHNALLEYNSSEAIFLKTINEKFHTKDYKALKSLKGSLNEDDIMDEYISVHVLPRESVRMKTSPFHAKYISLKVTDQILQIIDIYINDKKRMNTRFNILYIKEILQKIEKMIQDYNTGMKNHFSLLKPYKAMLQLHVSKYAQHAFSQMNDRYERMNGIQKRLNDYRKMLWGYFIAEVYQKSEEVSLGNQFCNILSDVVVSTVSKFLPIDVQSQILEDFSHTKFNLMTRILDDLAAKDDFDEFLLYICYSKQFAEKWVKDYSEEKLFSSVSAHGMTGYAFLAKRRIDKIFEYIVDAIVATETQIKMQPYTSVGEWLENFIEALNGCIPLSVVSFAHIADQRVSDMLSFTTHLTAEMSKLKKECMDSFLKVNPSTVVWNGNTPYQRIATKLWGCPECCPFCLEPCQKSDERHFELDETDVHTCIQHRPSGICGIYLKETNEMALETCNFKVQSNRTFSCAASHNLCRKSDKCNQENDSNTHLYRKYKDFFPSWDIAPSNSIHSSNFWSWFLCKYVNQLCDHFNIIQPSGIPESWFAVTKEHARESLRKALA